uniref:Uncharacterized protein n=1 Tax=Setaria viridis TaxID=4556 RepID=A0A4U6TKA4_SETVI|nr:hypothetical protein SEVIR_7G045705v2 [Setaria viridis]
MKIVQRNPKSLKTETCVQAQAPHWATSSVIIDPLIIFQRWKSKHRRGPGIFSTLRVSHDRSFLPRAPSPVLVAFPTSSPAWKGRGSRRRRVALRDRVRVSVTSYDEGRSHLAYSLVSHSVLHPPSKHWPVPLPSSMERERRSRVTTAGGSKRVNRRTYEVGRRRPPVGRRQPGTRPQHHGGGMLFDDMPNQDMEPDIPVAATSCSNMLIGSRFMALGTRTTKCRLNCDNDWQFYQLSSVPSRSLLVVRQTMHT